MDMLLVWLVAGLTLLIAEMATGSIVLIFISMGCFVSALVSTAVPDNITLQLIVCSVVSLLGTFLLRKPLQRRLLKAHNMHSDIGNKLLVDTDIEPHKRSRIAYQGTTWEASNVGHEFIKNGDSVTIVGMDGNILLIRKTV